MYLFRLGRLLAQRATIKAPSDVAVSSGSELYTKNCTAELNVHILLYYYTSRVQCERVCNR